MWCVKEMLIWAGQFASSYGLCLDLCWGSQESVMIDGTWKKRLFVFLLFRFETERARFYSAEIVCALKFLHRKGIVYRCVAETVFISPPRWAHSQTECRGLSQSWTSWYLHTNIRLQRLEAGQSASGLRGPHPPGGLRDVQAADISRQDLRHLLRHPWLHGPGGKAR